MQPPNQRRTLLGVVAAVAPSVVAAVALSVCGLVLVRALVPQAVLAESNDVAGNYLQTLGTIYAVLMAFVVIVVWQQFDAARGHVESEANDLNDLARAIRGFSSPLRDELHARCAEYIDIVLDREWDAMRLGDETGFTEGHLLLDRIGDVLHGYDPPSPREQVLYAEVHARLNELSDTRTLRLSSSRMKIPLALWLLLYIGSVVTIGSMYLFAVESLLIHALMTGAMAGMISHVLYVIADLDDCFGGNWQVPRGAFERVRAYVDTCRGHSAAGR